MKRVLSAAALVLAGATLTACGGGAPTDASESDFCDAFESAGNTIVDEAGKGGDEKVDLSGAIDELEETGTPEGIPDDAREGFEELLDALKDADGKTVDELNDEDSEDLDGDQEFSDYYAETCMDA